MNAFYQLLNGQKLLDQVTYALQKALQHMGLFFTTFIDYNYVYIYGLGVNLLVGSDEAHSGRICESGECCCWRQL